MKKITYLLFTATLLFFCSSGFAQVTMFIKAFDNNNVKIDGGSTAPGHQKDFEPLAYSHGVSQCATCGLASFQDLSITLSLKQGIIVLRQMMLSGLHLNHLDMTFRKSPTIYDFYDLHMEDVSVTSISEGAGGDFPTVNVTFAFSRIAWEYTPSKTDGTAATPVKGGWNLTSNTVWNYY